MLISAAELVRQARVYRSETADISRLAIQVDAVAKKSTRPHATQQCKGVVVSQSVWNVGGKILSVRLVLDGSLC